MEVNARRGSRRRTARRHSAAAETSQKWAVITGNLSKTDLKVDGCLERCFERLREDVGHLVLYSGNMHRRKGDWTFSSRLRQDLASHELVK